jgi:hypothetical protein
MGRWKVAGVTVIGGAAVVGLLMMRRWQLGWGATGQEAGAPLPGDDLIANPGLTATRGITIGAPAGQRHRGYRMLSDRLPGWPDAACLRYCGWAESGNRCTAQPRRNSAAVWR